MNREQLLISKWRGLNSLQQQEVLDFVDFIAQKSFPENIKLLQTEQKVQKWLSSGLSLTPMIALDCPIKL